MKDAGLTKVELHFTLQSTCHKFSQIRREHLEEDEGYAILLDKTTVKVYKYFILIDDPLSCFIGTADIL